MTIIFRVVISFLLLISNTLCSAKESITTRNISTPIRYTTPRTDKTAPEIVYYLSTPLDPTRHYPIIILCEGSSNKWSLESVLTLHQHELLFSQIDALNYGLVTVEQWGIDGSNINEEEFFKHYTRSQRLHDHLRVISHLEEQPPQGWNGYLIFIGASEGGPLVIQLSTLYSKTLATINWSGAGDWPWTEELWAWIEDLRKSFWVRLYEMLPHWLPFTSDLPQTRLEYDTLFEEIKKNPSLTSCLGGMTYLYHADAAQQPPLDYKKIYAPLLVVAGTKDSIIDSSDAFVAKAQAAGAPITYLRIDRMEHRISKRPDIINQSFEWLMKLGTEND